MSYGIAIPHSIQANCCGILHGDTEQARREKDLSIDVLLLYKDLNSLLLSGRHLLRKYILLIIHVDLFTI